MDYGSNIKSWIELDSCSLYGDFRGGDYNALGAAITTLIAFTFAFILGTHYSFKYLTFDIEFRFILKSIVASIIMSLMIVKWTPAGILNVLIVIGVCAVVYAAILLLLGGIKKEEIEFFRGLFRL
jgi:O-antigen/teichoic acid export membrane protein